jgi:hypothetical protein
MVQRQPNQRDLVYVPQIQITSLTPIVTQYPWAFLRICKGAEAVLRLRALRPSGDFDEYWKFHELQEYERNHASHYDDQHVPSTDDPPLEPPRTGATLKIVKKNNK